MKNLYSRLGIDRGASAKEVQSAFELKPELGDYRTILLHEEKRATYDTAHATLKMIGALRLRLGLDSGPSWFLKNYLEFAPTQKSAKASQNPARRNEADTTPAAQPAPRAPDIASSRPPDPSRRLARWLIPVAVVIIGVIVVAVLLR